MRKLTGPWLVMLTATLIFVPLVAYAGDTQGKALAAPSDAGAHSLPPAVSARGAMTRTETPSSLLTLPQVLLDLPGKHDPQALIGAFQYADALGFYDWAGGPYRPVETPFSDHPLLIDARLRHRGPPSSPALL